MIRWLVAERRDRASLPLITLILLCGIVACASSPTRRVSTMTLDQKVGQLVIVAAEGRFMNEESAAYQHLLRYVRDDHVGGVIWYGADVYETAWVNDRLQASARIPLIVAADLESGLGMRFENATFWPWPMAIAATGDPEIAEAEGRIVAREAKMLGINQIYAPVADVNNNPDNPVINVRSFGEDPETVSRFVSAFIRGVQSEGVLATVKHFPGHGDSRIDSHRSLPTLDISRERLEQVELPPFRAAVEAGVGSVMLAHLSLPRIDATPLGGSQRVEENPYAAAEEEYNVAATLPASLSPTLVNGLLRSELGFEGLVVTDALDMGGITDHVDSGEAAVLAILAGADQVLKSSDVDRTIVALKAAVRSGRISMQRLDESVERILRAKQTIRRSPFDMKAIFRGVDQPEAYEVALDAARRAVTLVREQEGALPIPLDAEVVIIEIADTPEPKWPLPQFYGGLRERLGHRPLRFAIDRRSDPVEVRDITFAAMNADVVLLAFTVRTRSGAGVVGVPQSARPLLARLESHSRTIAISFGNPYLLREVPALPTYLAAWGVQPVMQDAVVEALLGESAIRGRLPVTIPGIAARGEGIMKDARERRD